MAILAGGLAIGSLYPIQPFAGVAPKNIVGGTPAKFYYFSLKPQTSPASTAWRRIFLVGGRLIVFGIDHTELQSDSPCGRNVRWRTLTTPVSKDTGGRIIVDMVLRGLEAIASSARPLTSIS